MQNISMSDAELLKYAIENGMIDTAYVRDMIEMQKRKELLLNHPYDIYQGKDGKWYTYIPDDSGGRKKIKRSTKDDVEEKVIEYWRAKGENPTVESVFYEWMEDKLKYHEIERVTYDRYCEYFRKYFLPIADRKIRAINEDDIEDFVKNAICEFEMTAKCFSNFRTLVYGIFKRARKKKFVTFSITELIGNMEISKRSFKKVVRKADEQVFLPEEKRAVETYLEDHPDIINLGLLLMFKTGVRVGELAALRRSDIHDYTIFINRTETRFIGDDGVKRYSVKDFPKTEAGVRFAVIPEKYKWIIDKILEINPDGQFLFERSDGSQIRTYTFRKRLKQCEQKVNVSPKSPHKVRKTYGTILLDSNVRESTILDAMGHSDIGVTKGHYYFDRSSIEEKRRELESVSDL